MPARQYRSTVQAKTLSVGINNSIESMTLGPDTLTLPSTYPYTMVIDPDLASEEIVTVLSSPSAGTFTISRGQDGTSKQAHTASAVVKHMITPRDLQDAQNHIEAASGGYTTTNDGADLGVTGPTIAKSLHGIASGEGSVVGTLKTQTLTNKTLTSPVITGGTVNGGAALTVTSTQLNYVNGVTSPIQTQFNALDVFPKGMIAPFAGASAPTGWLLCDGSAVSRTTYSALFAVTSTTYGAGDGSTTFNLPDLLGRTPMGAGSGTGLTARTLGTELGVESVTLTAAQSGSPSHDHGVTSVGGGAHTASGSISTGSHGHTLTMDYSGTASHDHAISGASNPLPAMESDGAGGNISNSNGTAIAGVGDLGGSASVSVADHSHSIDITVSTATAAAEAHTNIQPSTVVNFIIKH